MIPGNRKVFYNSYLSGTIIFPVPNIITGILYDLAIFLFPKSSLIGWILIALMIINWVMLILFIFFFTDSVYKCTKYDLLVAASSKAAIATGIGIGVGIIAPAFKLSTILGFATGLYLMYTIMTALKYYACSLTYHSRKLKVAALLALTQFFTFVGGIIAFIELKDPPKVMFKVRGLPRNVMAIIKVGGKTYTFNGVMYMRLQHFLERWEAFDVTTAQGIYKPNKYNGFVSPGDSVEISYSKSITTSSVTRKGLSLSPKSTTISPPLLTNWDPKIWVGRSISVYEIQNYLGEGGNGYVLKAKHDNKEVAIKILKLFKGNPEEFFKELSLEALNLANLSNHPNIVKIYAFNVDSLVIRKIVNDNITALYLTNPPMIVMELMSGTLEELLMDDNFYYSTYWKKAVYKAIWEISSALNHLHHNGYVHMDVKPSNIFLAKKPASPQDLLNVKFKLGDLGSAVKINGKINQLTLEYSPPDVFRGVANPSLDIFALGMTVYVLLNRKVDRPDLQEMNEAFNCYTKGDMNCISSKVDEAKNKLSNWQPNLPDEIRDFVMKMISINPLARPTTKEVHEYFSRLIHSNP
jgi:serine/threonine protein kinase